MRCAHVHSYARITDDDVEVPEHGRGLGPWEPDRVVLQPHREGGVPW